MSKTDYTIRFYRESDLPFLHSIREAAFAPVFESFRTISGRNIAPYAYAKAEDGQREYLDMICANPGSYSIAVLECDGDIVGFCGFSVDFSSKTGDILLNAIDPKWAGQGLGTLLHSFVLDRMRHAGMRAARVGTGGDASHAAARKSYRKAGFTTEIPSVLMLRALE